MEIKLVPISVKELFEQYNDRGDDGVIGYKGKLDIRPPYQREFVYDLKQSEEVIHTVLKGFPLNIMYWVQKDDNTFEVLDGQQRTLSICKYLNHDYDITIDGKRFYWDSLPDDEYQKIINYELMVYICKGTPKEKLDWFEIVNIAGVELTKQELRNATYTGKWLFDAKRHFSKRNCAAYGLSNKYITGDPNRQELLEKALRWISETKNITIEGYMTLHQHDNDADELWTYFQGIFSWINIVFPNYRKVMKGLDWGALYNQFHNNKYNSTEFEKRISDLIKDEDVTSKKGIFPYLLSGDEKHLSVRLFDNRVKHEIYEKQEGICIKCNNHFEIDEMEADHITPWSKGGKTEADNCQMLCIDCNRRKSSK